jgi:6-phosphogluconolactonase
VVTGDYPILVLTIPSVAKPGAAATFKSKFAYVPSSDNRLYGYAIDPTTGKLTAVPSSPVPSVGTGLAAAAATPDGRRVYTVNTGSNYLSPYDIDPATGQLTLGPSMIGTNAGPSMLSFDPAGQNGYVLSPAASTLIAYPVDSATGMFNSGGGVSFSAGMAPVALAVADAGRFVFGIRNATIETYQSHPGTVSTAVLNPPSVSATADALAVHPSGRFVYVANGDASGAIQTFSVATVGPQAGSLTGGGSTPTGSMPASVAIDPTGRFLYTANGGSNDISGFSVDESTGALTPLGGGAVATGHHPISATVDYSGRFLFVVSDTDSSVSTYTIDPSSGALAPVSPATITGPMPKGLAISSSVEAH